LGLAGLVYGIIAFRSLRKRATTDASVPVVRWRSIALAIGVVLGVASWPLTGAMSYPYADGRAAGVPFMAAYFDARGLDYVGAITLLSVAGNALFWFLVPQVLLYAALSRVRQR